METNCRTCHEYYEMHQMKILAKWYNNGFD